MKSVRKASVAALAGCTLIGTVLVGSSQAQSGSPPPVASTATTATAARPAAASQSPSTVAGAAAGGWNFDADAAGAVPSGAQVFSGQWTVRAEADTPSPPNALCQT